MTVEREREREVSSLLSDISPASSINTTIPQWGTYDPDTPDDSNPTKPDEGDINKPFLLDKNYRADSNTGYNSQNNTWSENLYKNYNTYTSYDDIEVYDLTLGLVIFTEGKDFPEGYASFGLINEQGAVESSSSNNADGTVTFDPISFSLDASFKNIWYFGYSIPISKEWYGSFEIGETVIFDYYWNGSEPVFNFADPDSRNLYYDSGYVIFRNYPFTPQNLTFGIPFSIDYNLKMLTYTMYELPIVHYYYEEPPEPQPPAPPAPSIS